MNILHMKYAVKVSEIGSLNKAAEQLLIAQPNLSRCIKELEAALGITIFVRSTKGMSLTPEGEEFIAYAKQVLRQIDDIEKMYQQGIPKKQKFSISVPRASYISEAFAVFSRCIAPDSAEIFYKETNSSRAIHNILSSDYRLGIIRYAASYDKYFKQMLDEKELCYEVVSEFQYMIVASKNSCLMQLPEIRLSDLDSLIEIAHADPYVPSLPMSAVKKEELSEHINRRIFVFERASQFDLLAMNPETFMWVSPLPNQLLARYQLEQRQCPDNKRIYKDVLIHRKDYQLTPLDQQFITELCRAKRAYIHE
ncbi:MAG: LysR family transcriptional regulator [Oscillospiraceae bacterium]|nr:LysR family transcriptional regulator [Oscillospiraceae bacterium]